MSDTSNTIIDQISALCQREIMQPVVKDTASHPLSWWAYEMKKTDVNTYYFDAIMEGQGMYCRPFEHYSLYVRPEGYYLIGDISRSDGAYYEFYYRSRDALLTTYVDMRRDDAAALNRHRPRFDYGYITQAIVPCQAENHPLTLLSRGLIQVGVSRGLPKLTVPDVKTWNITAQIVSNLVGELPKQQQTYDPGRILIYNQEVKGFFLHLQSGYLLGEIIKGMGDESTDVLTLTFFIKQHLGEEFFELYRAISGGESSDYVKLYDLLDQADTATLGDGVLISPHSLEERRLLKMLVEAV